MKDSYIMHCDYGNHFELLTDAELGRLIRDVNNYVKNGVLPQYTKEDRVLNMAFSFMKTNIDIETEKYIKKCEKNRENGRRGGRPRNPEKPNGFEENPQETKKADTDTETDTDTDTDTETDTETDTDTNIKKSVCDKSARAKEFYCHLGSDYKSESCFYCMKKQICPNKESTEFRLNHRNETFDEWNKRHEDYREQLIEDLKSRGKDPDIELIDYDWLNEDNDID